MNYLIFLLLFLPTICNQLETTFGLGAAWNQLLAVEHYTEVNSQKQGKIVLNGPFNSGPWLQASLKKPFNDCYFAQANVDLGFEWKGLLTLDSTLQESPFTSIANLDGSLKAAFFGISIVAGANWVINDQFKMFGTLGYFYDQVFRSIDFQFIDLKYTLFDYFSVPIVGVGATAQNNCISGTAKFAFAAGSLRAILKRFPLNETVCYYFPLVTAWRLTGNVEYAITEDAKGGFELALIVKRALKDGCVKLPPTEANYSNNVVTFFKTDLTIVTAYLNYSF